MESNTHKLVNHDGSSYDTKLPSDLVEHFNTLRKMLSEISNGKYDTTPLGYDPSVAGISVGIIEQKENHNTKLPVYLSIK